jgi:hypothetical protein
MGSKVNKHGQVTIFVIVAIILVVGIAGVAYFMRSGGIETPTINRNDPRGSIEKCATDAAEEALGLLLPHGGYVGVKSPSVFYRESDVSYLCHTSENEKICDNLEPLLIRRIELEIEDHILPTVENCFAGLKKEFIGDNYVEGPMNLDIKIRPEQILILINKSVSFEVAGQESDFDNFDAEMSSPTYDFLRISNDIINQEVICNCGSETCNADVIGLSRSERSIEIERFVTGRNEKIYTLRDIFSGKEFMFGVRNCVRLPS